MAKKEIIDPEELMRQKFLARCRFRTLGRMVIANTYWLNESTDHYEGVEDVKRRVAQAVRGKAKKAKRLLTITDKALLNKPAADRTDHEKKYLYRKIGGLKCFKRYPDKVKRKLAAATYFKYYGPNRVIVKQHHEAHALYFIVSGDVVVSQMMFDELLHQSVSIDVGILHAGDMFGEVSLLHNIPRMATCTTLGHCELLVLLKEDFKNVLQASVQKDWDQVHAAMLSFTYFEGLDEVAIREGCIVAKMKSYATNETILGDGAGVPNFVYFLLSGQCQMIESLNIVSTTHVGHTSYKLYDPYVPKDESEQNFSSKYFSSKPDGINISFEDPDIPLQKKSKERSSISWSKPPQVTRFTSAISSQIEGMSAIVEEQSQNDEDTSINVVKISDTEKTSRTLQDEKISKQLDECNGDLAPTEEAASLLVPCNQEWRSSIRISVVPKPVPKYRICFMQVCKYNPGATFGFGENMRDRRIIALCPVECMLLPKMWLLQRNTANIWSRIRHYLDKTIPTKKQLFQAFVSERRWEEYRDQHVADVVARANTVNWTSLHDVPYSIRMEELFDV